jgi:hypothetical protein
MAFLQYLGTARPRPRRVIARHGRHEPVDA